MSNRRNIAPGVFVPVFIGFMGFAPLINFASKPGFDTIRTIDVVRLMVIAAVISTIIAFVLFGLRI